MSAQIQSLLTNVYRTIPAPVRDAIPRSLIDFARALLINGTPATVQRFEDKLWGGFSASALVDLERLRSDPSKSALHRAQACFSLARWHAVRGEFDIALALMEQRATLVPKLTREPRHFIPHAMFLCRLGRGDDARAVLTPFQNTLGDRSAVPLMLANTHHPLAREGTADPAQHLASVNAMYSSAGLATLKRRDPHGALTMDNLRSVEGPATGDRDNTVTIIVPAFNAHHTIETALQSLAEQSWRDIEVLVVDDCSTDDTAEIAERFCARDARFSLLRQTENGGSYKGRNRALEHATGRFVTIHDADDWAHPNRIEIQARDLIENKQVYNLSSWVRTSPDLFFEGPWRPGEKLSIINMGSLMFRREVVDTVGKWDTARISADNEFIKRLGRIYGTERQLPILADIPLALGRVEISSLTQTKNTHVATVYHGLRQEYHEAFHLWHRQLDAAKIRSEGGLAGLPNFPRPPLIDGDPKPARYRKVLIADWNRIGDEEVITLLAEDNVDDEHMRQAVFHYPWYFTRGIHRLRRERRQWFFDREIDILAPGSNATADKVVILDPKLFMHPLDRFPNIEANSVEILRVPPSLPPELKKAITANFTMLARGVLDDERTSAQ